MNLCYTPPSWKSISMSISLVFCLFISYSIQAQERNTKPTLDKIDDYSTRFSTGLHFIDLTGISAGDETEQEVTVDVSTGDEDLIESLEADVLANGKGVIYYR